MPATGLSLDKPNLRFRSGTTQANRLTFWSEGVVLRGEQARKGARNPWKGRRIGARKKDRLKERDDEEAGPAAGQEFHFSGADELKWLLMPQSPHKIYSPLETKARDQEAIQTFWFLNITLSPYMCERRLKPGSCPVKKSNLQM
mmetsp:Transcript_50540/g.157804  ORF Transcript_50540/g.157804 Transcript_50540/m.157804 type:complete len:144 (-) Transcript_50540:1115-1546(-)